MRRKVNNSETHETKRYYEVPSEKVQEWSDIIENLTKQRDQFKTERDTLIDDLTWYKAKVSRLERENRFLLSRKDNLFDSWRDENKRSVTLSKRLEQLEQENAEQLALLKEFRKLIDYKLTLHQGSSMYREYRSKLDQLGVK